MEFTPENVAKAFVLICVGLAILVPVVGITARIALKPIAELMGRMREGQNTNQTISMMERRIELLEREVQVLGTMREDVDRLREAQDFQLRLATEKEPVRAIEGGAGK
jgi:hypothetical protein